MMELHNASVLEFIRDLGSSAPAPGGGSVAAMNGAMAAALIEMVVNGALLINIFVTIVSCVIYYVVVLALVKDEIFYEVIHAVKNKVLKRG